MSTPASDRRRVLFVDDDADFLALLQPMLNDLSGGAWEILTAESASRAFALLQQRSADLAVLDVEMNVVNGVQLLALLNRGHPQMQKVMLTAFPSEKDRAACLANGAELFLEKPKTRDDWQSLYTALNELLRYHPEQGFRGVLRRVGLQDVIQMECLARNSSVVEISDGRQPGEIWIEEGRIVHAQLGPISGEEAFNHLLLLRGGHFNLKPYTAPPAHTIEGQWEFLLMEAAQKRDELQAAEAGPPVATTVPEHPAERAEVRVETLPGPTEARPQAPAAPPRPTISEVLVCSAQGEVLYEWTVKSRAAWVGFFEFLSQRSQRLAQSLNLGEFDRLEIYTPEARTVILINIESGVLVTTARPASPASPRPRAAAASAKDALTDWMRQSAPVPGEYFRALRFVDQTYVCDHDSAMFPRSAREPAWRFVADAFHLLSVNGVAAERLAWHYQNAALHCARRVDGTVLDVFTAGDPAKVDLAALGKLLDEFPRVAVA
jgi:CheY-like chemotaxis protein